MKRSKVLIHFTTWINLENIMLWWKKPDTKGHRLFNSIYINQKRLLKKIRRDRKQMGGCPGWGWG